MAVPNDSVDDIRALYRDASRAWSYGCSQMLMKIMNDSSRIGLALEKEEISRDEAIDALKRQAVAAIEAMK